jgi:riboflavin synthase
MFTGIVEALGIVRGSSATAAGKRLRVELGPLADGVKLGDSINLSGCCQTVAALDGTGASFDTVPETLRLTTLGQLNVGDRVNLERSLAVGSRLGGHFVLGHVDGTARLSERREQAGERLWVFEAEAALVGQLVPKGSVAIDGVSLTLVEAAGRRFSVALIPTTLAATTLGTMKVGDRANLETDVLGKYVRKFLAAGQGGGLSLDQLRAAGFIE